MLPTAEAFSAAEVACKSAAASTNKALFCAEGSSAKLPAAPINFLRASETALAPSNKETSPPEAAAANLAEPEKIGRA